MRIITSMSNLELAEDIVDNFGTHLTSSRIPQRRKFSYNILFLLYCHKHRHNFPLCFIIMIIIHWISTYITIIQNWLYIYMCIIHFCQVNPHGNYWKSWNYRKCVTNLYNYAKQLYYGRHSFDFSNWLEQLSKK